MAWLKIDDNAPHHRKMLAAGDVACWLWICGLAYCQRHMTDGLIPPGAIRFLGCAGWKAAIAKLVEVGLWHDETPLGYRVHDYLAWNDSSDKRREKVEQKNARQQKWRDGKGRYVDASTPRLTGSRVGAPVDTAPTPTPTPQPTPTPTPPPPKNGGGARGGSVVSPIEFEKLQRFNAYVGARLRVPHKLHGDFVAALGGDEPDAVLRRWYAEIDAELEQTREGIVPDVWKWLEARFKPWAVERSTSAAMDAWVKGA